MFQVMPDDTSWLYARLPESTHQSTIEGQVDSLHYDFTIFTIFKKYLSFLGLLCTLLYQVQDRSFACQVIGLHSSMRLGLHTLAYILVETHSFFFSSSLNLNLKSIYVYEMAYTSLLLLCEYLSTYCHVSQPSRSIKCFILMINHCQKWKNHSKNNIWGPKRLW